MMGSNFPDTNNPLQQLVLAQMLSAKNDLQSEPPQEPRYKQISRVKVGIQRMIRNLGTVLVTVGSRMQRVGRVLQEPLAQPKS